MTNTARTKEEIMALFSTNQTGQISAQDLRDFVETMMFNIKFLSGYSGWSAAITDIGSTETTLVVDTTYPLTENTEIPVTLSLDWMINAVVTGSYTFTVSGSLKAGNYQIFGDSVTVDLSNAVSSYAHATNFGVIDDNAATDQQARLQRLIDSGAKQIELLYTTTSEGVGISSPLSFSSSQGAVHFYGPMNGGVCKISANAGFTGGNDDEMITLDNGSTFHEFNNFTLDGNNNAKHAFYSAGTNNHNYIHDMAVSNTTGEAIYGQYWMTKMRNIRMVTVGGGLNITSPGNTTLSLENLYVIDSTTHAYRLSQALGFTMKNCAWDQTGVDATNDSFLYYLESCQGTIQDTYSEGSSGTPANRPKAILYASGGNTYVTLKNHKQQYGGGGAGDDTTDMIYFSGNGVLVLENNFFNNLENYTNLITTTSTAGTLELRNNYYKDVGGAVTQGLQKGTTSINANTIVKDFDFVSDFSALSNAATSVPTGVETLIDVDTVTGDFYNIGGDFDTVTHIYTCPTDGVYDIVARLEVTALGTGKELRINPVVAGFHFRETIYNNNASAKDMFIYATHRQRLSKGDTVFLEGYHNHGSNRDMYGRLAVRKVY
jgi:hypothetical protein